MRNKVINNAIGEIGYKEGAGNRNKYSKELYNSEGQEWCADFDRWCFEKAGAGDLFPVSSYVPTIAEWFDKKGQYKNSKAKGGDYTPQTGDIILFDYNRNTTSDHIGLVEKVENGKVHTIEGNKDNMVKRCVYDIDSKDIRAYCVPAYPKTKKKSVEEVAQEIATKDDFGGWGVYPERKKRLENAGYNYNEVQARVNEILKQPKAKIVYKTVTTNSNEGVNIRARATTNSGRIGGAEEGAKVQVLEENVAKADGYSWDKIKYKNFTGYVANKYLK